LDIQYRRIKIHDGCPRNPQWVWENKWEYHVPAWQDSENVKQNSNSYQCVNMLSMLNYDISLLQPDYRTFRGIKAKVCVLRDFELKKQIEPFTFTHLFHLICHRTTLHSLNVWREFALLLFESSSRPFVAVENLLCKTTRAITWTLSYGLVCWNCQMSWMYLYLVDTKYHASCKNNWLLPVVNVHIIVWKEMVLAFSNINIDHELFLFFSELGVTVVMNFQITVKIWYL